MRCLTAPVNAISNIPSTTINIKGNIIKSYIIGKNIKTKYLKISFVELNFLSEYSPTIMLSLNGSVIFSQINVPNKIDKTTNAPKIILNI